MKRVILEAESISKRVNAKEKAIELKRCNFIF